CASLLRGRPAVRLRDNPEHPSTQDIVHAGDYAYLLDFRRIGIHIFDREVSLGSTADTPDLRTGVAGKLIRRRPRLLGSLCDHFRLDRIELGEDELRLMLITLRQRNSRLDQLTNALHTALDLLDVSGTYQHRH